MLKKILSLSLSTLPLFGGLTPDHPHANNPVVDDSMRHQPVNTHPQAHNYTHNPVERKLPVDTPFVENPNNDMHKSHISTDTETIDNPVTADY